MTGSTDIDNANAANGQAILTTAITQAMSPSATGISQQLGGQTLFAGVYKSTAADHSFLLTSGILTLDAQGDPNAVWIFQMDGGSPTLTTSSLGSMLLINGANSCNIFWQVGSSATLGSGSHFFGNILATASITVDTSTIVDGRLLASTGAVTLDMNTVNGCTCPQ